MFGRVFASVCVKGNDRCAVPESQIPQITWDSTDYSRFHGWIWIPQILL